MISFIDLFAGIGGIRKGLEQAIVSIGETPQCVFTSEIKPSAVKILHDNHPDESISGDITQIDADKIPDFDILCAGFPCQAFSSAGKRQGFADTRGTLFFHVERILKAKRPKGFILENVEGLVNHDKGKTFATILTCIDKLGYKYSYKVLNAKDFGVPQDRKRVYIVGSLIAQPSLEDFESSSSTLGSILEHGLPCKNTKFTRLLLKSFSKSDLYGKSIKDKRGGDYNIHSWDLQIKGQTNKKERNLLNSMMRERRKKKWAEEIGIDWMDGMPLTFEQISTFYVSNDLQTMLNKLTSQGYLVFEHPKKLVRYTTTEGIPSSKRIPDETKPKGYNIVSGKLSFEINKILDPNGIAPTLVAMDMDKLYVVDSKGLRQLTLREGLRLFGYPEDMKLDIDLKNGYDLLGNTVVVPVIRFVANRVLSTFYTN